jgi:hypothetical protein
MKSFFLYEQHKPHCKPVVLLHSFSLRQYSHSLNSPPFSPISRLDRVIIRQLLFTFVTHSLTLLTHSFLTAALLRSYSNHGPFQHRLLWRFYGYAALQ